MLHNNIKIIVSYDSDASNLLVENLSDKTDLIDK